MSSSWQSWFDSFTAPVPETVGANTASANSSSNKLPALKGKKTDDSAASESRVGEDLQELNNLAKLHCWTAIEQCASSVDSIHHTTLTPAGNAPLHSAISNGAPLSTVQALVIANPPSVALRNNFGNTPLHFAAWKNKYRDSYAIVEFLLDYHPQSAQAINKHGKLPLHHATNYKAHADIVQILYRAFPKAIAVKNDKDRTPLDDAIHRLGDKHPIVAMLQGETARNYVYQQFTGTANESSRGSAAGVGSLCTSTGERKERGTSRITAVVWDNIDLS